MKYLGIHKKYIRVDIDDLESIELCRAVSKKKYMTQAPAQRTQPNIESIPNI